MAAERPSWQSSAAAMAGRPMAGMGMGTGWGMGPGLGLGLLSATAPFYSLGSASSPPGRGTKAVSMPFTAG